MLFDELPPPPQKKPVSSVMKEICPSSNSATSVQHQPVDSGTADVSSMQPQPVDSDAADVSTDKIFSGSCATLWF